MRAFPRRAAVIGSPIGQSLSPAIHRAAFAELGIECTFDAIEVLPGSLPDFVATMRRGEIDATSVTMPHKETIAGLVDEPSEDARALGAVNCVWWDGRILHGAITDGEGCCDALESVGGAVLPGASVLLLGAGGTARAIALSLARRGATVHVENRTVERAHGLVDAVRSHPGHLPGQVLVGGIDGADVVVNATSVGMNTVETLCERSRIARGSVVLDAVYTPLQTRLLSEAASAGARCVDGLWMLIHQARRQEMLWFGRAGSADSMREESLRTLASRPK